MCNYLFIVSKACTEETYDLHIYTFWILSCIFLLDFVDANFFFLMKTKA